LLASSPSVTISNEGEIEGEEASFYLLLMRSKQHLLYLTEGEIEGFASICACLFAT
jgi:hypothetical protein